MRELAESDTNLTGKRSESPSVSQNILGKDSLERKFRLALLLYGVLAVLAWFTMGADKVPVMGRPVEMRWLPELVFGVLVLRTVVARQAERIRRDGPGDEQRDGGSAS